MRDTVDVAPLSQIPSFPGVFLHLSKTTDAMRVGFDAKRIFHNTSGLGNYSRDVVRILNANYPEHTYLLYNPKPGKVNRMKMTENMLVRYPEGFLNKRFSSYWRHRPIASQLIKDQVELYHGLSNELPAGIRRRPFKTIVTIHDLIFMRFPQWYSAPDRQIYTAKAKHAVRYSDQIIAISEQTANDLVRFLGVPREKITVIYQGCHAAFKQSYSPEQLLDIRKKFQLPASFVLSVGTIEERKNLLTTVKSLHHHPLSLVVVGRETPYLAKVKAYIAQENLGGRVYFLQHIDMEELAAVYRMATLCCYPSLYEGFGIPIIEALYSKIPVITTQGGCFREAGGPHSVYIDSTDEKVMGESINAFLQDTALYRQTIAEGFKFVQKFNDQVIAAQIMALYHHTLQGSIKTEEPHP